MVGKNKEMMHQIIIVWLQRKFKKSISNCSRRLFLFVKQTVCAIYNFGTNRGDTICLMSSKVRNSPTMRLFFTAHDRSEISSDIDDITYVYTYRSQACQHRNVLYTSPHPETIQSHPIFFHSCFILYNFWSNWIILA